MPPSTSLSSYTQTGIHLLQERVESQDQPQARERAARAVVSRSLFS